MNYSRAGSGHSAKAQDAASVVFQDSKCCQTEEEEAQKQTGLEDNWTQTEGGWSRLEKHRSDSALNEKAQRIAELEKMLADRGNEQSAHAEKFGQERRQFEEKVSELQTELETGRKEWEEAQHQKAENAASTQEAQDQLSRENKDLNLQIQYLRNAAQNQEMQWT